MTLKTKIKVVDSLPPVEKKKFSIIKFLITLIVLLIIGIGIYFLFNSLIPYIKAVKIDKIEGKRIYHNECNTLDYITISPDKSFTMELYNDDCEKKYYEGDLIIKNNEIIFNDNIKGIIDSNYNIVIDSKLFEKE